MKLRQLRKIIADAREIATMERAGFRELGHGSALTFEDGSTVTESNVTEFIRERTRLWRSTWILGPLDEALALIDEEIERGRKP